MTKNEITPISEHLYGQDTPVMVSIVVATYYHERHIVEAIESFLIQKTNFRVEILVKDDASTDETAKIVRQYEEKYPQFFVTFYQTVNQYSQGKYIALCEGDDYRTDPYKLQ
jgi:glycosyltransferase involved in cell wall biosynthesis